MPKTRNDRREKRQREAEERRIQRERMTPREILRTLRSEDIRSGNEVDRLVVYLNRGLGDKPLGVIRRIEQRKRRDAAKKRREAEDLYRHVIHPNSV